MSDDASLYTIAAYQRGSADPARLRPRLPKPGRPPSGILDNEPTLRRFLASAPMGSTTWSCRRWTWVLSAPD
jgi:hypothetical protein